jgi:hypothetical protein
MLKSLTRAIHRQLEYLRGFEDTLPSDRILHARSNTTQVWDKKLYCWVTPELPDGVITMVTDEGRKFKITIEEVVE